MQLNLRSKTSSFKFLTFPERLENNPLRLCQKSQGFRICEHTYILFTGLFCNLLTYLKFRIFQTGNLFFYYIDYKIIYIIKIQSKLRIMCFQQHFKQEITLFFFVHNCSTGNKCHDFIKMLYKVCNVQLLQTDQGDNNAKLQLHDSHILFD